MKVKITKDKLNEIINQVIKQGLIKSKSQMNPKENLKQKKEFFKPEEKEVKPKEKQVKPQQKAQRPKQPEKKV